MRQALLTYLIRVWSTTLSNGLCAAVHIRRMSGKLCVAVAIVLVTFQQAAADEYECGTLDNGLIGPWDYHDPRNHIPNGEAPKGRAKLVENAHFTPIIEALKPRDKYLLAQDIVYTLRAFPNHPRALLSLAKLEEHFHGKLPGHSASPRITTDCFFERAFTFRPEDGRVWAIYALVLHRKKRYEEALTAYENAESYGQKSAQMDYNIGLLLIDMGKLDDALERARRAYAGGFALPGLKRRLEAAGRTL